MFFTVIAISYYSLCLSVRNPAAYYLGGSCESRVGPKGIDHTGGRGLAASLASSGGKPGAGVPPRGALRQTASLIACNLGGQTDGEAGGGLPWGARTLLPLEGRSEGCAYLDTAHRLTANSTDSRRRPGLSLPPSS